MQATLYDLVGEYRQIEADLLANGGEMTQEIEERMEAIGDALPVKLERYYHVERNLRAAAEAAKEEAARLAGLAKVRTNAADRMKERAHEAMKAAEIDRLETATVRRRRQPGGYSVQVAESVLPEFLPDEFRRHTPAKFAVDKKAVTDAHKAGRELPDGITVARGESLVDY